jgi:epoxyqueuosine reductase
MLKDDLKAEAYSLGFSHAGVTTLQPPPHLEAYRTWLARGCHAGMGYLARPDAVEKRADPSLMLPGARSILCLALDYSHPDFSQAAAAGCGQVAAYAWGKDYHLLIPSILKWVILNFERDFGKAVTDKGFTDTAPILERDLAQRAGLGWIGKNTCLIHPKGGSFFFLAEILLDLELEPDPPVETERCGTCRKCIEACPTGCIQSDRTIDARRCISYLTIENKGIIPRDLRPHMGSWIFGCDVCQMVCPWNLRTWAHVRTEFIPDIAVNPILREELALSPAQFNQRFRSSPIQRAKRRGYLRNVAVALGNQPDPGNLPVLEEVLMHEPEALIRAHALWALQQHHTPAAGLLLDRVRSAETDPLVLAEFI